MEIPNLTVMTEPTQGAGRSILSTKSGVRWYLCDWSSGCNMPCRTNPHGGGDQLCRWHQHCARATESPGLWSNSSRFAQWLDEMQAAYPSTGYWSLPYDRLWPVVTGNMSVIT